MPAAGIRPLLVDTAIETGVVTRADLAVVLVLPPRHPLSAWNDAWRHFWALERPTEPTADDLAEVLSGLGLDAERWDVPRPPLARATGDTASRVPSARPPPPRPRNTGITSTVARKAVWWSLEIPRYTRMIPSSSRGSAEQAAANDQTALSAFAARYGSEEVLVAAATPVGTCFSRIAVSTLLRCCPPGPPARVNSITTSAPRTTSGSGEMPAPSAAEDGASLSVHASGRQEVSGPGFRYGGLARSGCR